METSDVGLPDLSSPPTTIGWSLSATKPEYKVWSVLYSNPLYFLFLGNGIDYMVILHRLVCSPLKAHGDCCCTVPTTGDVQIPAANRATHVHTLVVVAWRSSRWSIGRCPCWRRQHCQGESCYHLPIPPATSMRLLQWMIHGRNLFVGIGGTLGNHCFFSSSQVIVELVISPVDASRPPYQS